MPAKSKKAKKAINKELKLNNGERREPKKEFNSSSDEHYSLVSNQLSLVDDLRYDIEHHVKRDEVDKFINHLVCITIAGDEEGKPSIKGVITAIKIHPSQHVEWVVVENAIMNGNNFPTMEVDLNSIISIMEENDEELAKTERPSSQVRRPSATSGYDSQGSRRASRSYATTPTKDEEASRSRSKSQEPRKRIMSGPSKSPDIISTYAAALKGHSDQKSEEPVTKPILRESSFPPISAKREEVRFSQGGDTISRPKTPSSTATADRPKTPGPSDMAPMSQKDKENVREEAKKKLYPSLPSEDEDEPLNFRLNEPVIFSKPPPPADVPRWYKLPATAYAPFDLTAAFDKTRLPASDKLNKKNYSVLKVRTQENEKRMRECSERRSKPGLSLCPKTCLRLV